MTAALEPLPEGMVFEADGYCPECCVTNCGVHAGNPLEEAPQEEQSEPAYDPHAAFGALQGIVDQLQRANAEATRVLAGIAGEIEYINEQRISVQDASRALGETAKAILGEYSQRVADQAKLLRKGRKGVTPDRLDFLDPTQIWTNKYSEPYWFLMLPWEDPNTPYFPKGRVIRNGDAFFGIECPQLRKALTTDEADQPLPLEPFTTTIVQQQMSDRHYLMVCNRDGIVHRIPGDWFKDIRVFDRDRFEMPLLSNMQIAQLLAIIDNPSLNARSNLLV